MRRSIRQRQSFFFLLDRFRFHDKHELDQRSPTSERTQTQLLALKSGNWKTFQFPVTLVISNLTMCRYNFIRNLNAKWQTWPVDLSYYTSRFNTLMSLINKFCATRRYKNSTFCIWKVTFDLFYFFNIHFNILCVLVLFSIIYAL